MTEEVKIKVKPIEVDFDYQYSYCRNYVYPTIIPAEIISAIIRAENMHKPLNYAEKLIEDVCKTLGISCQKTSEIRANSDVIVLPCIITHKLGVVENLGARIIIGESVEYVQSVILEDILQEGLVATNVVVEIGEAGGSCYCLSTRIGIPSFHQFLDFLATVDITSLKAELEMIEEENKLGWHSLFNFNINTIARLYILEAMQEYMFVVPPALSKQFDDAVEQITNKLALKIVYPFLEHVINYMDIIRDEARENLEKLIKHFEECTIVE